ncbi:hypothetical protein KUTeg_005981 [Tegillarca granosa]|uniref:Uncharacterized protein n=1 Tax=Tegillarca granosa TaxID=220873 RepID=A0ABQ9FF50_TEGGR|nr:hypothetical protein KUTeg_005981 [Tegillarca granosa]
MNGHSEVVKTLIDNESGVKNVTHIARHRSIYITKNGHDKKDRNGFAPIDLASCEKIKTVLLRKGAKVKMPIESKK